MSKTAIDSIETEYKPGSVREPKTDEALFTAGYGRLPSVLKRLGFEKLRPGQDEAIYSVLGGVDSICVMPTAGGKSAIFIIPTLCNRWKTIVFSPLLSLMRDQVKKLQNSGIAAFAVSSDSTDAENEYALRQWVEGECELLYIAPERLLNATFKQVLKQQPPDMIVVDETHVISAWNDNFRHAYTYIGEAVEKYNPRTVLAVTATFNERIEEDVRRVLAIPRAKKIVNYTPRDNLHLSSTPMRSQQDLLDKVRETDGKILIYCGWRKNCAKYAEFLSRQLEEEVGIYHSTVTGSVKKTTQDRFARKDDLRIVCATNAFGMGVDIPDIEAVIHAVHPSDPESLDQEIGRGGRSGQDCYCHAFSSKSSENFLLRLLEHGHPTRPMFELMFKAMRNAADGKGVFHLGGEDLERLSRVEVDYHGAITQTLMGSKVLEPVKGLPRFHQVKILKEPDWDGVALKATQIHFGRMIEFLRKSFELNGTGFYDFDMDTMASMLGLAPNSMASHFNAWSSEGLIQHEKPPRSSPMRIAGDLKNVDFERLKVKREEAFQKLDYVIGYFGIPDSDKSKYLRDYFLATAGS